MDCNVLKTINLLFEQQVKLTPNNIALIGDKKKITYKELNEESNRRAHYLVSKGAKCEDFIGIVMDHSTDMIINIFAVIKSGAAYIAIEPTFPRERINNIIEQADIKFLFTQHKYKNIFHKQSILIFENEIFDNYSTQNTVDVNSGNNPIYVLFTSGTTGTPKGVVVEQHNVYNYVLAFKNEFQITEQDRMLQNSVCTFDIFTEELYPILMTGGTLVIANNEDKSSIERLVDLIEKEQITVISGFPYLLSDINKYKIPNGLRIAISGGDVLRKEHVNNLLGKVAVYNTYGPTETTVCASYYRYETDTPNSKTVPIGKAIYGTEIYVLDKDLNQVNPSQIGEICITGNGVTRGYLNRPKETEKYFIDNPYKKGERMYLSGDLGLLKTDGNIEFIRRKDEQVMIGGKRVEPLEVEGVIHRYPCIENAIITSRLDSDGYPYLLAYYSSKLEISLKELKCYLEEYLPEYMIPEYFIKMEVLPKTENGKIDRKQLPVVLK